MEFNKYFDHTLLKPDASEAQIRQLCREALEYDFYSVCVNGCHVALAAKLLAGSNVKTAAVVGFPLGAMNAAAKVFETQDALENDAQEIDMVINIGALKDGNHNAVQEELRQLAGLCHGKGALLKAILEVCLLSEEEIMTACRICVEAGADFVKTSTGFSAGGATKEAVTLMKQAVGDQAKIKASGGIRTLEDAQKFINAGADRLGCSASVSIMKAYSAV